MTGDGWGQSRQPYVTWLDESGSGDWTERIDQLTDERLADLKARCEREMRRRDDADGHGPCDAGSCQLGWGHAGDHAPLVRRRAEGADAPGEEGT